MKKSVEKHLDMACGKLKGLEEDRAKDSERLKQLEVCRYIFNCVPFVWRIPNFEKLLQESRRGCSLEIFSDPLYTSPQGYKMIMEVNPNGWANAKGSHLSLFIHLMKGEYDSILSWPFQHKIKITLIDQHEEEGNRQDVSMFIAPHPLSDSFQRPVKEVNPALGFPKFVSHADLQTRRYIVDKTIFIKIEVG